MNKIATTLVGGALLTSALLSSPIAAAFADGSGPSVTFLAHVKALGFTGPTGDRSLVNVGYDTCTMVKRGNTVTEVQSLDEATFATKGYTKDDTDAFVTYAINDLCPHAGE